MSIRLKDTIYNTANYSTDSDKLDGYDSSHYMQYKSASTPATAQWYRIAQTGSGISNNIGIFEIYGSTSGYHTDVILEAGTSYGNTAGTTLVQTSCAAYSSQNLTKARIVYHTSYSGNYAYLEVYLSCSAATTIYVKFQGHGWTLVAPNTVGSIPSGYSTKEITFTKDAVVAKTFVGALSGNASTATSATTATTATSATSAGKLTTARTISLTGSVTGSGSFDGSGNLSIATTTNHNHNSSYVTALGTSGNYLTWTKNGTTNNITIPYATSAGNADTLDNYHAGSFGIWRGNVQTDPEADDTTYTTTADFLKQIHARTSIFNSNFSAFRGSWYYVGNVNYNTGVGSLEMAGTAVLNISGNCTNDVNYKSLIFLDRTGELFSYVSQESGVAKWSRYLKSSEVGNGTITIKQAGTSKGSFTVNQSGNTTIELTDTNTNTTYSAGTGISLSGTTFSNSGVRSIATGTSNGTISVNTNGTTANVAVKGLGSAAYTASTAYAAASHTHTKSQITDFAHTHDYAASSHSHGALASGWYTTFTVNGDANTYYPVVLNSVSSKYPMQLVNISRGYAETAPNSWNTSTHRGGLTLTLLWNGSRYWDGNGSGSPCHCVYKYESYCTMVGGLGNSTAGIVVWLRGGGAVYYLHSMNGGSATATVHLSTYTDSASNKFAPTTTVSSFSVGWPYALNADKVDNNHSSAFAAASHNHDSAYAAKSHTHSYAASSHTHSSILDSGNSTTTTFAYSKAGLNYADYTWLAGWNGYELRAINKSQFAQASHTHSGYASSSHTHNYAGSSSAGGAATSANKLNTNAGSATKPVYFSGGVPVQVTGCMVQYWAIYEVYFSPSGTSGSTITKKAGNHNFCSSISSNEALGQIIVNTSYPSGFDESTTMIFGVGDHAENYHYDSVYITINKQYGGGTQMRLILADDDRQNWGYAHLYFLCIG